MRIITKLRTLHVLPLELRAIEIALCFVILSEAKDLKAQGEWKFRILRFAQNDNSEELKTDNWQLTTDPACCY